MRTLGVEAYLLVVTKPDGEVRRELYHSYSTARGVVQMYANQEREWKTALYPLFTGAVDAKAT